jgi:hypothetical protein|tara:strand:- start:745 stop:1044 length:300 start_codon:yes stop_codon:yes gene_type:complete
MDAKEQVIEKETSPEKGSEVIEKKSLLEESREVAKLLTEENNRREQLIEREERLAAENMLGGVTEAGQETKEEKKEMSDKEYAQAALEGKVGNEEAKGK